MSGGNGIPILTAVDGSGNVLSGRMDSDNDDLETEILEPEQQQKCDALDMLEVEAKLLCKQNILTDEQVRLTMNNISQCIGSSSQSFAESTSIHGAWSAQQRRLCRVEVDGIGHEHSSNRSIEFQRRAGEILRQEVFDLDLLTSVAKKPTIVSILTILRRSKGTHPSIRFFAKHC